MYLRSAAVGVSVLLPFESDSVVEQSCSRRSRQCCPQTLKLGCKRRLAGGKVAMVLASADAHRHPLLRARDPQALSPRSGPRLRQLRWRQQRPLLGRWPRTLREQHLQQLLSFFAEGGRFSAGGVETRFGWNPRKTLQALRRCRQGRSTTSYC